MLVPRIDRGDDRVLAGLADRRRGIGGQRGQPHHGLAGGQCNSARRRQSHAQAGKAAGPGGHRDAIECREADGAIVHDARDQRHQGFGMAALHRQRFPRDQPAGFGVQHGGGAGIEGGIDGEDQHPSVISAATD